VVQMHATLNDVFSTIAFVEDNTDLLGGSHSAASTLSCAAVLFIAALALLF